ncbi:MAG: ATP-binding protein [Pseudomonadota bacterium]
MKEKRVSFSRGETIIEACYRKCEVDDHLGNPLIEALPPIRSREEWYPQLARPVTFHPDERNSPAHLRAVGVMRIQNLFQVLPRHVDVARRLDLIIRQGYVGRNPANAERGEMLQRAYQAMQLAGNADTQVVFGEDQPMLSSSLIGASGTGKSTTIERILRAFPQVIAHPDYGLHQIVWLKVDCPQDGSIKQLCVDIIKEMGRLLDTNFPEKINEHIAAKSLANRVKHYASVYSLGLLVIDEIQNLSIKKSGGKDTMLNFFQELCNVLRVPVFIMGTLKAANILSMDFRHARRNAVAGSFVWDPLDNGSEWESLVQELWKYQWLQESGELTEEMIDFLHQETQGIVGVLTAVFTIAQLRALDKKQEAMTQDLLRRVMDKDFLPIKPALNAMRSRDPRKMMQYQDMLSHDFMEYMRKEQLVLASQIEQKVKRQKPTASSSAEALALSTLETMGFDSQIADEALKRAKEAGAKSRTALVQHALAILSNVADSEEEDDDPDDLRKGAG